MGRWRRDLTPEENLRSDRVVVIGERLAARRFGSPAAALGRDLQMARLDFAALSAASPVAKTLWLPDMNHVLVDVTDDADNMAAYNQSERALNSELVDSVAAFILADDAR